ncbi:LAQU0S08e02762g1_1 [Lachancea quebecensis]|uniref:LAQU0S08e02762g1_1 n=1 Tax=Lachancea quebecensis TaxID=1654605 RepID=A0A0N7MLS8_9SACH|nr:LAQU0S08e02762g1_1 [Lachancea quebecensis]
MTSVTGSPSRGKNPFIERYMASLGDGTKTDSNPVSPAKTSTPFGSPARVNVVEKENFVDRKLEKSNLLRVAESPLKPISPSKQNSATLAHSFSSKGSETSIKKSTGPTVASASFDVASLSKRDAKYYEFLCRVKEAKEWIEAIIEEKLPSELDLAAGNSLRDGVYLAKLTQKIEPGLARKIVPSGSTLQFTHTQNINSFFRLVESVGVPDLFRFELTDLYEKKNIPQVFETLHALANVINSKWPGKVPEIQNLSGLCSFSSEDLKTCQRKLPMIHNFRSFKSTKPSTTTNTSELPSGLLGAPANLVADVAPVKKPTLGTPLKEPKTPPQKQREISKTPSPISQKSDEQDHKLPGLTNTLTDTAPLLKFDMRSSPAKSLSYYSPRIYRHLSYRTASPDIYSTRLSTDPYDPDYYNTLKYTTPEYSPVRRKRMTEVEFLDSVSNLQAICRGVNTRFGLTLRQRKVDMVVKNITLFQAYAKAGLIRLPLKLKLQSETSSGKNSQLGCLQAIIRANQVREKIFRLRVRLLRVEDEVTTIQAIARAAIVFRRANATLERHSMISAPLIDLQAYAKGYRQRNMICKARESLLGYMPQIVCLQGLLRSRHLRKHRKLIYFSLNEQLNTIYTLQALARGTTTRRALQQLNNELELHSSSISKVSAVLKGSFKRCSIKSLATAVRDSKDPVISLQALSKGVLARFALELVADVVEANHLMEFQSLAKGSIVRRANRRLSAYYKEKVADVIRVQSFIRSHQLRVAYIEFMSSANPSLWAVRKFVHLLNKIYTSHESQNKLEWLKSQIDQANKSRDKLQTNLNLLQRKSEILESYNIFVGSLSGKASVLQNSVSSSFPGYEKLIYLLQADPFYWKTVARLDQNFASKYLIKTFSSANGLMTQRENAFFVKLVADLMITDIENFSNVQDFLSAKSRGFWQDLLVSYIHRQIPDLMKELFQPVLDFISSDQVDFESIPSVIYRKIHPHGIDLSSSQSIEDDATKRVFVQNLTSLWNAVEIVSDALTRNVNRIGEDVKFLCTAAYKAVADRSPYESDALLAISKILIEVIIASFLKEPTKFGSRKVSIQAEKKVAVLLDVLTTVYSFTEFQGYLTPLNQYAEQISTDLALSLKSMLTSPSFENFCDKLIYGDMCQETRAGLSISKQYLVDIGDKLKSMLSSFPHDDPIVQLYKDMSKSQERQALRASTDNIVDLRLNPSAYQLSSNDDRLMSVYNEIKRGLVYMMQVEDVETNLYDLMTSSIIMSDEPIFQELVHRTEAIKNDPLLKNLESLSYFNLKQHVLERAYELKQMDSLTIEDGLQSILNDIANTIKSREYVAESTTNEAQTAQHTLKRIQDSTSQLQEAIRSLETAQKRALKSTQSSNTYAPSKKHGLGNKLKDVYKKVNHKSNGDKNCLSLEWTTRHLHEIGVLNEISGENLGKVALSFFGSNGPKFPDILFKISTSDGEVFAVEMNDERKGDKKIKRSGTDSFAFSKLVDTLAKDKAAKLELFTKKVEFNVPNLLSLVATSFLGRRNLNPKSAS